MISPSGRRATAADGETLPQIGDRIVDKSAPPDDHVVREWIGPAAFGRWAKLRNWIDEFYPGVFAPDWLYGGRNRGWSLRYKKTRAFCTLVPEYRLFSAVSSASISACRHAISGRASCRTRSLSR